MDKIEINYYQCVYCHKDVATSPEDLMQHQVSCYERHLKTKPFHKPLKQPKLEIKNFLRI